MGKQDNFEREEGPRWETLKTLPLSNTIFHFCCPLLSADLCFTLLEFPCHAFLKQERGSFVFISPAASMVTNAACLSENTLNFDFITKKATFQLVWKNWESIYYQFLYLK